ncbi:MAG: ABC transporter permease [Aestuariivita sp.]|nr:ABC transporter permease [Aestuariivita sp.]
MARIFSVLGVNAREASDSLRKARLRTTLGMIGIMVGISSVIAMISIGEIAQLQARQQFESLGTDMVIIRKSFNSSAEITLSDAVALSESVSSLVKAAPRILGQSEFWHSGKRVGSGSIHGVTSSFLAVNRFALQEGRFISDFDIGQYFCVIGSDVAEQMRSNGTQQVLGEIIEFNEQLYKVVGVMNPYEENYSLPVQINSNQSVFIPITTALRTISNPEIEVIIARSKADIHHEDVTADIQAYFQSKSLELVLEIITAKELILRMEAQMNIFSLLLGAVGSISLIVGGIGIMNIMIVSIAERRKEIAIRRALGARRSDIQSQFLIESIILTTLGGIFGILFGLVVTWGICQFIQWDFLISGISVASGLGTAVAAGLFFGFQPAYQASQLDPIAGLQSE